MFLPLFLEFLLLFFQLKLGFRSFFQFEISDYVCLITNNAYPLFLFEKCILAANIR